MVAKRIIPCLDVKDGRTVKGVQFTDLCDLGCPIERAKKYCDEGADELVLLDISASDEGRAAFLPIIESVAKVLSIPFTVGGGIASVDQAWRLIDVGADKISINTAAIRSPKLITNIANRFGSQSVVVAIDSKSFAGVPSVYGRSGKDPTGLKTLEWISKVSELGAGEILLTSIDFDGTKQGFDYQLLQRASQQTMLPIIASGGAGKVSDFTRVFKVAEVSGALAAGIFHREEINIKELKKELMISNIEVRI